MENNKIIIDLIKEERKNLLKKVREDVLNGKDNVIENIDSITTLLKEDEENIKKYEALKSAQQLIESLIIEISHAEDKEDIIKLRSKLNYYINKIKNEAKKRNIDYAKCDESISNIRKSISKCVCLLKKDIKLNELSLLNDNYDNLTVEEKKQLSKKLSYEKSYNKHFIKEKEIINNVSKKKTITNLDINYNKTTNVLLKYNSDREFISSKIDTFDSCYKLIKTNDYSNSICQNIITFIKNVSVYHYNKKMLRMLYRDYRYFYRKEDLRLYIKYTEKNNSFKEGIKSIFNKSALYNKENIYLDSHDRCIDWIMSYIKNNDVKLNYTQAK